jgi:methylase of polypeptide subunit release factors
VGPSTPPPSVLFGGPRNNLSKAKPLSREDCALLALGQLLRDEDYRFTTITPLSHRRVSERAKEGPLSVEDVFGWNCSFQRQEVSDRVASLLQGAGALQIAGSGVRSRVRFSTLGDQLFMHSAFPTDESDAVFFGPDTYRFGRAIKQLLTSARLNSPLRILDIGTGSGAGGLYAARLLTKISPTVVLADINHQALRYSRINAMLNAVPNVQVVESDLYAGVAERFDLIISNPPYLVDSLMRLYRHGGGDLGSALSLDIVEQGIEHLAPGGCLLLYTGSAIVRGEDVFHTALCDLLSSREVSWTYEEIDPDVFGEELEHPPYDRADRIAVVALTVEFA